MKRETLGVQDGVGLLGVDMKIHCIICIYGLPKNIDYSLEPLELELRPTCKTDPPPHLSKQC